MTPTPGPAFGWRDALALLVLCGASASAHAVIEDCDNGVSFNNGATTRGLTATVRCVDRETRKPYRTVGLRDGKEHGPVIWFNAETGKPEREEHYRDGKRDGLWRRYDREGRLTEESTYSEDRELGPFKRFDKEGRVRALGWAGGDQAKSVRLDYDASGQLTELSCSDASRIEADREPCGFGSRSTVRFAPHRDGDVRTAQYLNGKLDGIVRDSAGAEVRAERDYVAGEMREERQSIGGALRVTFRKAADGNVSDRFTYFSNGGPKAHAQVKDGRAQVYESWWQNGKLKLQATLGERDAAQVRTFHDDGAAHETYAARLRRLDRSLEASFEPSGEYRSVNRTGQPLMTGRYERYRFVGEDNVYDENNVLRRRMLVEADGARREILFDERGKQVGDNTYFADGSSKR